MSHSNRPALVVYSFVLSGHCHRVALMCSLLGLQMSTKEVDLRQGAHQTAEFLGLNPLGQVPVLVDGDVVIPDSNAALIYLACTYDERRTWYPVEGLAAARVQRWLSLAAGELASGPATARAIRVFNRAPNERAFLIAKRLFDWMEGALSRSAFTCGSTPTVADVAMYSYTAHAPEGGVSLEPYPAIRAWLARIEVLPGFIAMG
jgi:glutathione S-transferase